MLLEPTVQGESSGGRFLLLLEKRKLCEFSKINDGNFFAHKKTPTLNSYLLINELASAGFFVKTGIFFPFLFNK